MSTKTTTHHTRRAPLSLSGGGKQQGQNHYGGKSADSNGNSNNSASAKNDNKHTASQKTELSVNDAKESTPKDLKKLQNVEKKQQQTANCESVKKNEKTDEKKTQNGNGKAAANGGAKEKHQNGSDKQDNNSNSSNTKVNTTISNSKTTATNANGNSNTKSNVKSNEKAATVAVVKEDTKTKEQKSEEPVDKIEKESVKQKENEIEKHNEKEKEKESEKEEEKEKEKEKDKKNEQEKIVEKDTKSRRQDSAAASTADPEKKQLAKNEPIKSDETKTEVSTPTSRSGAGHAKLRTTPTTAAEKTGKSTPTKAVEKTSTPSTRNKTVTTVIDDVEMEPLAVELSPAKSKENTIPVAIATTASVLQPPAATSTPGKAPIATLRTKTYIVDAKSDHAINALNSGNSPDRKSVPRTFNHIGGRRSIRPLTEYTPSKFQSNSQFRESYRRINTELDVSSTTNTSMNVTVGSEIPNNSSFSFFGRGRKRDRTPPPQSRSAMELQTDADDSPPKRARLDMYSLFSVVSSPLTMLRSRFSRASIQSSTPVKLTSKLAAENEDEVDVQNVSGISIEEGNATDAAESDEKTTTEDVTVGKNMDDDSTPKMDSPMKVDEKCVMEKGDEVNDELDVSKSSNVHEVAAGIADTSVSSAKNKRCNIM